MSFSTPIRRASGPRPDLHHRPRQRHVLRGDRGAAAAGRRARARLDPAGSGALLAALTGDSQLRWIGPDKGVMHLATGAVVNAVWDLWAKAEGKPVWRLVAEMSPEEIVRLSISAISPTCITPEEALALLRRAEPARPSASPTLEREGLSLLHDLGRLARLSRRQAAAALPGGGRRRLQPRQDEGRPRPRRRHPAADDRARGARARIAS